MTAPATLAFVAAPAVSPTITLSLDQPGLVKVKADSFSLGAPEFEGDPYSGTGVYGEREVEFTLQFTGTYEEAATALQSVSRQLTQGAPGFGARNWLMLKWAGSQPYFAQTLKSSLDALDWRQSGVGVWELPVSIACDGFLVGPPEDIASFTITNDPSSGTNRMMVGPSILGTVKGDVETPLLLAMTASSIGYTPGYISSYALTGGFTHSFLARNLTDLTSGTDVGARVTAAGANYIEGDYKACTFASTTMAPRLSGQFASALSPMPGLYRALIKGVVPDPGAGSHVNTYTLKIQFGSTISLAAAQFTDPVTVSVNVSAGSATLVLVDLGVTQIPTSVETSGIGLAQASSAVSVNVFTTISASAANVSGSMQPFRFDELFLLPVDTTYGTARSVAGIPSGFLSDLVMYDGIAESVRQMDDTGSGAFSSTPYPTSSSINLRWVGGLPTIVPGANNYLQFVLGSGTTGGQFVPAATTTWQARYYPRYVHAKPAGS